MPFSPCRSRLLALSVAASVAFAVALPAAASEPTSLTPRLDFLAQRFDEGETPAQAWWWGWLAGYAALTVGQGAVLLAVNDRDLRANMGVGAGGSLVGLVLTFFADLPARGAAGRLRELRSGPGGDDAAALAGGVRLLDEAAEAEAFGRSWICHLIGLVTAAAQGLVLWLAFDLPIDGAISFAVSMVISEAQIWTQPTQAIDDRDAWNQTPDGPALTLTVGPGVLALHF